MNMHQTTPLLFLICLLPACQSTGSVVLETSSDTGAATTDVGTNPSPVTGTETETATETEPEPDECEGLQFQFDQGADGFTHAASDEAFDDPWELGEPDGERCYSGDSCWNTRLDGDYGDCEAGYILSPTIDLSACADPDQRVVVQFWHLYRFEEASSDTLWDGGLVQFSDDDGSTWRDTSPDPAYDGIIEGNYGECGATPEIDGHEAWSEIIRGDSWTQVQIPVSADYRTAEFRIRFLFGSDRAVTDTGWYIDDVEIRTE